MKADGRRRADGARGGRQREGAARQCDDFIQPGVASGRYPMFLSHVHSDGMSFYAAGGACGGRQREGAARQCVAPLRPGAVHRVAVLQAAFAAVRRPAGESSYTKVYSMICDPGSVPD